MHEKPETVHVMEDGSTEHLLQVLVERIGYTWHRQQTLIYQSEMVLRWPWQEQVA
jgi:hypothetical protein